MDAPRLVPNRMAKAPLAASPHYAAVMDFSRNWVFNIGIAVAGAAGLAALGLFFYQSSLNGERDRLRAEISDRTTVLQQGSLEEVIDFSRSLSAARDLLARHPFAANVFPFLRANVHRDVQFRSLDLGAGNKTIALSAAARTYSSVAEQVRILEAHPDVASVAFGGLARGEFGLVTFNLTITVEDTFFRFLTPEEPAAEDAGDTEPVPQA